MTLRPPHSPRAWRAPSPRRGFTLVELLVVIGIVAVLTGIAAGFLGRVGRSLAVSAFRGRVSAVLRTARNSAVAGDSRSTVEIEWGDPENGQGGYIRSLEHKVVGMWHLEIGQPETGARDNDLTMHGRWESVPGRIGGAQRLGKGAWAEAAEDRLLSLEQGGTVQAWIMPEVANVPGVIASKGSGYKLEMDADGQVHASVRYATGAETLSSPSSVSLGRWTHLELAFTRKHAELFINGRQVARYAWKPKHPEDEAPELKPEYDKPFVIGAKSRSFQGRVDHVMVSDLGADEIHWVPVGVQFLREGSTTSELHFLPTGALDPREHIRPETITLRSTVTGKIETLKVGLMGDIR